MCKGILEIRWFDLWDVDDCDICAVHPRCRAGEGSLIHIKSKTSDNLRFPKVSFAVYPYSFYIFIYLFLSFMLALVLLNICISHLQYTREYQCYWLRIGNKPSLPRDCTWHCNTPWTGEDEPFPIRRLTWVETLKHFLFYFYFSCLISLEK